MVRVEALYPGWGGSVESSASFSPRPPTPPPPATLSYLHCWWAGCCLDLEHLLITKHILDNTTTAAAAASTAAAAFRRRFGRSTIS